MKSKSKNVPSHRDQKKIVRTNLKDPDAPKTILDALADSILPAGLGPDDNRQRKPNKKRHKQALDGYDSDADSNPVLASFIDEPSEIRATSRLSDVLLEKLTV